jgi:hypothetical protein
VKYARRWLPVVLMVLATVVVGPAPAWAAVRPLQPYSNWQGLTAGYYNLDERLTISTHTPDADLFWAHQFGFAGGGVGYIGLQLAPGKKFARFSMWDATAATGGPNCHPFGGEGTGYTCELPSYAWVTGRAYRLRVWALEQEGTSQWWGGWIQDTVTGIDTYLGKIRMPHQRQLVTGVSWTEYYGPDLATCDATPRSRVWWDFPTANNGAYRATGITPTTGSGSGCTNTARSAGVPGGGLQELGTTPLFTSCSGTFDTYLVSPGPVGSTTTRDVQVQGGRTDDGAPVEIRTRGAAGTTSDQRWRATCQSDGSWTLTNLRSGKCLTEPQPGDGVNLVQSTCTGASSQRWWHDYRNKDAAGRDYWVLVNKQDFRCQDIEGLGWSDGVPVQVWTCYGGWNQLLWFWS